LAQCDVTGASKSLKLALGKFEGKNMQVEKLTAALLRDRNRTPSISSSIDCFLCGRSFTYRGHHGDDNGRFCSDRCRDHYDAGRRRAEPIDPFPVRRWRVVAGSNPGYLPSTPMRPGKAGWHITCPGCQRDFESNGLRRCSPECERADRERAENLALMAEAGMEPKVKRQCTHPGCTATVPKWRNGRRVSERARFCDFHTPGMRPKKRSEAAE
jgi:hypothetical protein